MVPLQTTNKQLKGFVFDVQSLSSMQICCSMHKMQKLNESHGFGRMRIHARSKNFTRYPAKSAPGLPVAYCSPCLIVINSNTIMSFLLTFTSSSSFIVCFPCHTQDGRFPPNQAPPTRSLQCLCATEIS